MIRHDALRLLVDDVEPRQRLSSSIDPPIDFIDLSASAHPEAEFLALTKALFEQSLPVDGSLLFRITLARAGDNSWYWLFRCHHLIADGLSMATFCRYVVTEYNAERAGGWINLSPGESYFDFVEKDASYRASARSGRDLEYWLSRFRELPEPTFLPRRADSSGVSSSTPDPVRCNWERFRYERFLTVCEFEQHGRYRCCSPSSRLCWVGEHAGATLSSGSRFPAGRRLTCIGSGSSRASFRAVFLCRRK